MEINTTEENIQKPTPAERPEHLTTRGVLAAALVIGFIAGSAGGAFGFYYAVKNPNFVSRLGGSTKTLSQQITVNEDSAVIDVVKQASPAVVSIVISKDLNKLPGFGGNPYSLDPFSQFFGYTPRQPSEQSEPNIQQIGAGSGFFATADGVIITNRHVVEDEQASYTVVTNDGQQYEAKVLARDPVNDLAILKVEIQNAPTLTFADTSDIQIGSRVVAIGNSLGQYQNTVTTGVVSGIGRSITAGGGSGVTEQLEGVIQTDAAINPGNSGGPLLNIAGQVIGINTAIDQQGQLVGFAIPANDAQRDLVSYQSKGKISRPYLGVRYVIVTKALAEQQKLAKDYGALVVSGDRSSDPAVIPGSPADKAGLKQDDIILELNGTKIDQDNTLTKLLKNINAGDTIRLRVLSNGQEKDVSLTVGER